MTTVDAGGSPPPVADHRLQNLGKDFTFAQYIRAAYENYERGGVTWAQSYVTTLIEMRPLLAARIRSFQGLKVDVVKHNIGGFLNVVLHEWNRP